MPTWVRIVALILLVGLLQLVIAEIGSKNGGILNTIKREVR